MDLLLIQIFRCPVTTKLHHLRDRAEGSQFRRGGVRLSCLLAKAGEPDLGRLAEKVPAYLADAAAQHSGRNVSFAHRPHLNICTRPGSVTCGMVSTNLTGAWHRSQIGVGGELQQPREVRGHVSRGRKLACM
jgi:hypothetical protein